MNMQSSSSPYLQQPCGCCLLFPSLGFTALITIMFSLNHLHFSHTYFLSHTEPQTAENSLAEMLTVRSTAEGLLQKGSNTCKI